MAEPFDVGSLGLPPDLLPSEFNNQLLENLDRLMAVQEQKLSKRVYDDQEERGFFRSGGTQERITNEVLGPAIDRRRSALFDLIGNAVGQESAYRRQKDRDTIDFNRRLDLLQREMDEKRQLLQMQKDLLGNQKQSFSPSDFLQQLGSSFAQGAGRSAAASLFS